MIEGKGLFFKMSSFALHHGLETLLQRLDAEVHDVQVWGGGGPLMLGPKLRKNSLTKALSEVRSVRRSTVLLEDDGGRHSDVPFFKGIVRVTTVFSEEVYLRILKNML